MRNARFIATGLGLACAAALLGAPGAHAAQDDWSRTVDERMSAASLGLPPDAPARRLGMTAIERSAGKLGGAARLGDVRFAQTTRRGDGARGATPMRALRYHQTLGGLRVLWSELDVAVTPGAVESISATVVPLRPRSLSGERRISARRARTIARREVPEAAIIRPAEFVVFAGSPAEPRAPRRAYVAEVYERRDSETALCVIVDAQTGRVLDKWWGFAARPTAGDRPGRPAARAAATKTYLTQFVDAGGKDVSITGNFRQTFTMGNPFVPAGYASGTGKETTGVLSDTLLRVIADTNNVTEFICLTRDFCGRDSGSDGSYNRHFVTGNWCCGYAEYRHSQERIYLSGAVGDTNDEGTIAHEFGHQADARFRNDYLQTVESDEVDEALAEMFGYDHERDSKDFFPGSPSVKKILANPSSFKVAGVNPPARQADYNCTAGLDEHVNGYILGHAYYRLVQRLGTTGHQVAGDILQFVPWRLPAKRTFGAVREAFERIGEERWGPGVELHVDGAFNEVGVADSSSRTKQCPGAKP
jgi:hypothetical protein